jgi:sialate O-acetylesterase
MATMLLLGTAALLLVVVAAGAPAPAPAGLRLDAILSNGMVLPNDAQLWGTTAPHAALTATVARSASGGGGDGSIEQQQQQQQPVFHGTADASGSWAMNVSVLPAGLTLYNITIVSSSSISSSASPLPAAQSSSTATLVDVMFGAVIICAGQSNMAVTLDDFGNYTNQPEMNVTQIYQEASAYADQIRLFTVTVSGTPPIKSAADYGWGVPSQDTLGGGGAGAATGGVAPRRSYFSAECWGAGIAVAKANPNLPLGLIVAARGGAAIQSFMSKEAVAECPHASPVNPPHFGGVSAWWTGMMEPLRYIRPNGWVWHQGEENSGQPNDYECFQRAMIAGECLPSACYLLPSAFCWLLTLC